MLKTADSFWNVASKVWDCIFYDEAIKSKNRKRMGGETL